MPKPAKYRRYRRLHYLVACLVGENEDPGRPERYVLATSRTFLLYSEAEQYVATLAVSRKPIIIEVD